MPPSIWLCRCVPPEKSFGTSLPVIVEIPYSFLKPVNHVRLCPTSPFLHLLICLSSRRYAFGDSFRSLCGHLWHSHGIDRRGHARQGRSGLRLGPEYLPA